MEDWNQKQLPSDLEEVGRRLREARPEANPLELDTIKTRALQASRSASRQGKGRTVRSRLATIVVAFALLVGGTAIVMAAAGGNPGSGGSSGSAPNNQYCPPSSNADGKPKNPPPGNQCGQPNPGKP
jgi:hypothetical protein